MELSMRRYDNELLRKVEDKLDRLANGLKDDVVNTNSNFNNVEANRLENQTSEPVSSNIMKAFLEREYRVDGVPDYRLQIESIHYNKEKSLYDVNTKDGGNFVVGYNGESKEPYLVYFRNIPSSLRDHNILDSDNLIKTYSQNELEKFQQPPRQEVNKQNDNNLKGVRIPEKLHELFEMILKDKSTDNSFNKKIIDKAIENLGIVKKVEGIGTNENKDTLQTVKELRAFENALFKDTVKLQKDITLSSESLSLTVERNKALKGIVEIEGEKEAFLSKSKNKTEIDRLNNKVNEINIVIQNRGEALSVKEIMPSHKKMLEASFDATKAVSDLVRKTIETVSQIEHIPSRQYQPVRANVQQLER